MAHLARLEDTSSLLFLEQLPSGPSIEPEHWVNHVVRRRCNRPLNIGGALIHVSIPEFEEIGSGDLIKNVLTLFDIVAWVESTDSSFYERCDLLLDVLTQCLYVFSQERDSISPNDDHRTDIGFAVQLMWRAEPLNTIINATKLKHGGGLLTEVGVELTSLSLLLWCHLAPDSDRIDVGFEKSSTCVLASLPGCTIIALIRSSHLQRYTK